jgi:RNA polymerase sigma-70 factor (ECF subfamily)
MGAGDDADDILQDVWLKLKVARGPVASARAYLYRMVYTAVLDRKRAIRRTAARDGAWTNLSRTYKEGDATPADAERALIARETLAQAEARLVALGEPANSIFRRHRLGGDTQRKIADDLGMGLSTVEKHLRKAYAALLDLEGDHEA